MKSVVRTTLLVFGVTVAVGGAYLAADTLWFGNFDPKLGGPWNNFVLGVQLLVASAIVEAVVFGVVSALFLRVARIGGTSAFVSAVALAFLTLALWPPQAHQPFLLAGGNAVLAFVAGAVVSVVVSRSRRQVRVA